jgi:hypothetical protein
MVNGIKRPILPLDNLLHNGISDLGHQTCRDLGTVHLLKGIDDIAGTHAPGVEAVDLLIHAGDPSLAFANELGVTALWLSARRVSTK